MIDANKNVELSMSVKRIEHPGETKNGHNNVSNGPEIDSSIYSSALLGLGALVSHGKDWTVFSGNDPPTCANNKGQNVSANTSQPFLGKMDIDTAHLWSIDDTAV